MRILAGVRMYVRMYVAPCIVKNVLVWNWFEIGNQFEILLDFVIQKSQLTCVSFELLS